MASGQVEEHGSRPKGVSLLKLLVALKDISAVLPFTARVPFF